MRWGLVASLCGGLALTIALVHFGAPGVTAALGAAGIGGLAVIAAARLASIALMGVAWWLLAGGAGKPLPFVGARLIRAPRQGMVRGASSAGVGVDRFASM